MAKHDETAEMRQVARDVVRTFREGSYLADEALEKIIYAVLLEALAAREAAARDH